MALTSITNNVQSSSNDLAGQGPDNQQGALAAGTAKNSGLAALIQDSFTPSNQNNSSQGAAQEAGLFQVSPNALIAAASATLAAQTTLSQANQNPALAQVAPAAATNTSATLPAATNSTGFAIAQPSAPAAAPQTPAASTQSQILFLNQALTALGLTNSDIQKLDQIASLVNVFSPTAFNDLIRQFQILAQQAAQLSPVNNSVLPAANSGGYQVQGLSIQFSGSTQASSPGQSGSQGGGTPAAPTGLQLGSLLLTLGNAAGRSANIQAPQQKSGAAA